MMNDRYTFLLDPKFTDLMGRVNAICNIDNGKSLRYNLVQVIPSMTVNYVKELWEENSLKKYPGESFYIAIVERIN